MSNYWAHTCFILIKEKYVGQYATGNRRQSLFILALFLATYFSLHEDWDPVAAGIRWLYNKLNFCTRLKNKLSGAKSRTKLDEEQSESLIDNMPVISSFFTKSANLSRFVFIKVAEWLQKFHYKQ
ncbi:hypothetical protein T12_5002 [Trichinella patagoniensis]|uniref:Uncharacterized protein n=1 Tax=Trichinella patagoniensis TaxID=990121 RepID=A0A0V0ZEY9_9BILA|nr:hypothetical protein T12_5002 [Trichinella patagoniensis]